jgi:hypothetical protein
MRTSTPLGRASKPIIVDIGQIPTIRLGDNAGFRCTVSAFPVRLIGAMVNAARLLAILNPFDNLQNSGQACDW